MQDAGGRKNNYQGLVPRLASPAAAGSGSLGMTVTQMWRFYRRG